MSRTNILARSTFYALTSIVLLSACLPEPISPPTSSTDFDKFYISHGVEEVLGEPVGQMIILDELLAVAIM